MTIIVPGCPSFGKGACSPVIEGLALGDVDLAGDRVELVARPNLGHAKAAAALHAAPRHQPVPWLKDLFPRGTTRNSQPPVAPPATSSFTARSGTDEGSPQSCQRQGAI